MQTVKIINKTTCETNTAVYAPDRKGNIKYNEDGKFLTDKAFDKTYGILPKEGVDFVWRSHMRNLFDEILLNKPCWILDKPLRITIQMMAEIAQHAERVKDEKLIGYCCRFALYTFSDPTDADYNKDLTNYYISLTTR